MTTHPLDLLPLPGSGKLIFTPCPGTRGVALQASIVQLRDAGASAVITMMPEDELQEAGVGELPAMVIRSGMQWFHMPVEDDAAPTETFQQRWQQQRSMIIALLDNGETIAVHCRGGSGRTGLMAAAIMGEQGIEEDQATALVRGLRPNSLKLPAHLDYLKSKYWNTEPQSKG
ncbi:MAG: protein phosphatase [Candidatus Sedimenticola endophacoides]|nr:MAG: protein phosphatase [Candidatus Sedimenticola endophacoides]PUD98982.1 MAG: protein phosphatase [Candidatus Sedimenticola endophacoides]PUE02625.1 MAG: protein phosphatase [Candidatus Sedimenticola endophacoides]PUE02627.1 MAG: protein phosphatase [Candidatus Sedimenticola endophacoides]